MQTRLLIFVLFAIPLPAAVHEMVPRVTKMMRGTKNERSLARLELSPSLIDLGDLAMGEESSVNVNVTNRSDEVVRLKPPIAGCGCISPTLDQDEISPGDHTTLRFTFRAPAKPGTSQKKIVLQTEQSRDIWELPIAANVVADAWVSPSRMDVAIARDGKGTATGAVSHVDHVNVIRVTSSDPDILTAKLTTRGKNIQRFEVVADAIEDGVGELTFYGEKRDEPVATLPVHWRMPRRFACHPQELSLDTGRKKQQLELAVIIDSKEVANLTFEPVVDWIVIQSMQKTSSRIIRLVLLADSTLVPNDFHGPVLVVADTASRQTAEITVRMPGHRE